VEEIHPVVIKKDGRREPFSREKISEGILRACQKRPISMDSIEEFIDSLEQSFQESGRKEIATTEIGEQVMAKLHEWDDVAYVRFASVYRQFKDPNDFVMELQELLESRKKKDIKIKKK
jgi:transcriptional repressor NrdR